MSSVHSVPRIETGNSDGSCFLSILLIGFGRTLSNAYFPLDSSFTPNTITLHTKSVGLSLTWFLPGLSTKNLPGAWSHPSSPCPRRLSLELCYISRTDMGRRVDLDLSSEFLEALKANWSPQASSKPGSLVGWGLCTCADGASP